MGTANYDGLTYLQDNSSTTTQTVDYEIDLTDYSTSTTGLGGTNGGLDFNEIVIVMLSLATGDYPSAEFDESTWTVGEIGEVAAYTPQSINDKWYDETSNANHGTIDGATSVNRPDHLGRLTVKGNTTYSDTPLLGISSTAEQAYLSFDCSLTDWHIGASGNSFYIHDKTNSANRFEVDNAGAVKASSGSSDNRKQVARVHNQTITGDNSSANFTILHNLGTTSITVSVREQSSYQHVECAIATMDGSSANSTNNCRVSFATSPGTGVKYDVTVIG